MIVDVCGVFQKIYNYMGVGGYALFLWQAVIENKRVGSIKFFIR